MVASYPNQKKLRHLSPNFKWSSFWSGCGRGQSDDVFGSGYAGQAGGKCWSGFELLLAAADCGLGGS